MRLSRRRASLLLLGAALLVRAHPARAATDLDALLAALRDPARLNGSVQRVSLRIFPPSAGAGSSSPVRERELSIACRVLQGQPQLRVELLEPAEVRGTVVLLLRTPDGRSEQHLYLPALKKVSLLVGLSRRASFVGSDLSFEDLDLSWLEGASARLLAEDERAAEIELRPREVGAWSSLRLKVEREGPLLRQVDFLAADGAVARRLEVLEAAGTGPDRYPRKSRLTDLRKGSRTEWEVLELRRGQDETALPTSHFDPTALTRTSR